MRKAARSCLAGLLLSLPLNVTAATLYVDLNSTNATPPYTNWITAATNIQDAVDQANAGDEIVVTNGVYQTGGRALYGTMTNRVAVDKAVALVSVNGPEFTVIQGAKTAVGGNGDGSIRCVSLASGASLSGFTLTNGATRTAGNTRFEQNGGGAWCESAGVVISNCILTANSAYGSGGGAFQGALINCALAANYANYGGGVYGGTHTHCVLSGNSGYYGAGMAYAALSSCTLRGNSGSSGGGAYGGTLANCLVISNSASYGGGVAASAELRNCFLTGNSAASGGGAASSTLYNCTVTRNTASSASGGARDSTLNNSIVYFNTAPASSNYSAASVLSYCCTTPLPPGAGNIIQEPQFTIAPHLSVTSPCRSAGSIAYASGTDIDGEAWLSPPAIGCDEYRPGAVTGPLSVAARASYTNALVGYSVTLTGDFQGRISYFVWDMGDGTTATNQQEVAHAWASDGDYEVVLTAFNESYPAGVSATQMVHVFTQPMVHYVDAGNAAPAEPYTSWSSAARTIQDAVDQASMPGALILVTNGVYQAGGKPLFDAQTNRVAVGMPLRIESVNGPLFTLIQGDAATRCVSAADGVVISGFTLTNGATAAYGGAVRCASTSAVLTNCTLIGNSARSFGGGAYRGTLNDCTLTGNAAEYGGGADSATLNNCTLSGNSSSYMGGGAAHSSLRNCAVSGNSGRYGGATYSCTLYNCTLTGNSAMDCGGALYGTLKNCILYYNSGVNYEAATMNYCCTTPLPDSGSGNISQDPELASAWHLSAGSPCHAAGDPASASGTDIDGEAWASGPSIGCDEYVAGAVTGPLDVAVRADYTYVLLGFAVNLVGSINGHAAACSWDFGDGTAVSNRPWASHAWTTAGDYPVVFRAYNESQPGGMSATQTIHVFAQPMVHYVDAGSAAPRAPYTSWASAARTIQEAVDAAPMPGGSLILVTNGVYVTGGKSISDTTTNRVAVDKAVRVQSINGPQFTVIEGYQVPGTTNGASAIRCVYLAAGASLSGFTLTKGATAMSSESEDSREYGGGGLYCESVGAVITNCTLTGNSANFGGGVYSGLLINCTLTANSASSGGGGTYTSTLVNCTLAGNSASYGGGAHSATLDTCIAYYNNAPIGPDFYGCSMNYCCSMQLPDSGAGNITNAPLFVDQASGNLRLQSGSPCINAGNNAYVIGSNDADGRPRIVGGAVDMGAYEFQGAGMSEFIGWLQRYSLPTDGSGDFTDSDGDHYNNWQEWQAGSNPTNDLSAPPFITAQPDSQLVVPGGEATFWVTAVPTGDGLSYQWLLNGTNDIPNATNAWLTLSNAQAPSAGLYSVRVTNVFGSILSSNAVLEVDYPPVADASATLSPVISSNGLNATVVLDGSRSSDLDGDPLQYGWFSTLNAQPATLLGTGVVAVVVLPVGIYPISLVVSDGVAVSSNTVVLAVLTSSQAVERLVSMVSHSGLAHPHRLMASLQAALTSLNGGDAIAAINQLRAFQNKLGAHVAPSDPVLAQALTAAGQQIIDALYGGAAGRLAVKVHGLKYLADGTARLSFSGLTGQVHIMEASTNLVDWERIGAAVDRGEGSFDFEDSNAAKIPRRFYRVVSP